MILTTAKSRLFLLFSLVVISFSISPPVSAKEVLRILAWPGYADQDIVVAFEKRYDVDVEVSFVNSDDALWEKINANNGGNYDVFAVNTAELQRYIDKGLSIPINLGNIPNRANQLPRFQKYESIPGIIRKNQLFAIPYTYSEMGLIYNRKKVKNIPQSMSAMWDPDYRGRVLAYNTSNHNFSIAALLMGVKNPFQLDDKGIKQAARQLVQLRRNVLTFYSSPEEAVKLYVENEIVLIFGNYGSQQVTALKAAGADIGYIIPREGALAWLDCWAITRGAKNNKLAERWINYSLEKNVSERLTKRQGLANTITPFPNSNSGDKIIWLEPLENYTKRKALWDRIQSGDTLETF